MRNPPSYRKKTVRSSKSKVRHYAMVRIDGNDVMLGDWNTPASKEKYKRVIAEWFAHGAPKKNGEYHATVTEVCIDYTKDALRRYLLPSGKHSSEVYAIKRVMKFLRELYGSTKAIEFKTLSFKTVRDGFVREGLTRNVVNKYCRFIIRAFELASENEKLPIDHHLTMKAVKPLEKGRTSAQDPEPIGTLDMDIIEATLAHLNPIVRDMVNVQLLTGMRPGEVCQLKPADIDRTSEVWVFVPETHKTAHRGHSRSVSIGPDAQKLLRPYLLRADDSFCFAPSESSEQARRRRNNARVTPEGHGNCAGDSRKENPKRTPGQKYSTASYRRAIHRACDVAEIDRWSPNRIRKTCAVKVRKLKGLEACQAVLGHMSRSTTERFYAQMDVSVASEVMAEIG